MNKYIALIIIMLPFQLLAQNKLSGVVMDRNNIPIADVSISMDKQVGWSDTNGVFNFVYQSNSIAITLLFNKLGYKQKKIILNKNQTQLKIILVDSSVVLTTAVIQTAQHGRFANYAAQSMKLSSLESVTNPSALGDIFANLTIMPGVQTNANSGRLIVQGGATHETQFYINDLIVTNPYSTAIVNQPSRSKFSADLFDGINLQAGGYGSEFGQALAGIVQLNTLSKQQIEGKIDLAISSVGVDLTQIVVKPTYVYRASVAYQNLKPYQSLFPNRYDWSKPYQQFKTDLFFIKEFKHRKSLIAQLNYNQAQANYSFDNVDSVIFNKKFKSNYLMGQVNFYSQITDQVKLQIASNFIADVFDGTDLLIKNDQINQSTLWSHSKINLTANSKNHQIINKTGFELMYTKFDESYLLLKTDHNLESSYNNALWGIYHDTRLMITPKLTFNIGLRSEYANYLNKWNWAPRSYLGYSFKRNHSLSLAVGSYYQLPEKAELKQNNQLDFTHSYKITTTYAYAAKTNKLQVNVYYNQYKNLIYYASGLYNFDQYNNSGSGDGLGFDFFWKRNVGNLEYWLTYSFNNTQKSYGLFRSKITPEYLSKHNLSLNLKYWVPQLKSLIGIGSNWASGNTFYKLNDIDKTGSKKQVDLTWSYLPVKHVIIHLACQNIFGTKNVYGYEYSQLNPQIKREITTLNTRFFFIGIFITLSKDKTINQLKSL